MIVRRQTAPTLSRAKEAKEYARCGLPLVPMHTIKNGACSCKDSDACTRAGKHPCTAHGVNDASADTDQIKAWWERWPKANIGIAAGDQSGILVLDIDPRNGGDETLNERTAELGPLPETVTALTGGNGRHLFFKYPSFAVRKDSGGKTFGPGVDVLSNRSIVIVPPSLHASGQRYRWQEGHSIFDREPAELPSQWLERLRGGAGVEDSGDDHVNGEQLLVGGQRNTGLTSLAGRLRHGGLSAEALLSALVAENEKRCSPPLDVAEVEGIAKSIAQYPAGQPLNNGSDTAEQVLHVVLEQHFSGGQHLMFYPDGQFWRFDGRKWAPLQRQLFDKCVEDPAGHPAQAKQHVDHQPGARALSGAPRC